MKNYYAILGIEPDASKKAVRKAYRTQAKKVHPDAAGDKAAGHFLDLKEAYEVLYSPHTRESYDKIYQALKRGKAETQWNYHDFLSARKEDPQSLAKLICYDLLHDLDREALNLYDQAAKGGVFSLKQWLDREDFMDFTFLLAEAYRQDGALIKSWRLLWGIAVLEEKKSYFKHFYAEVLEPLYTMVSTPLDEDPQDQLRLLLLENLLTLSYPIKEKARIHKIISEIHTRHNHLEKAARHIYAAEELDPKIPGLADIAKLLREEGY